MSDMDNNTAELPANEVVDEVAAAKQIVIPGSVTEGDLELVFNRFIEWVGWDDPTCIPACYKTYEKRRELLLPRRDKLAKKLARIQAKLDEIDAELRPPEQKKAEAKEYLAAAVAQMGAFGSMEVLTTVLKNKYPKVIIRPKARKDAPAAEPAPVAGTGGKEGADEIKAGMDAVGKAARALDTIRKVQEVLDHEGMTLAEIKKLVSDLDGGTIKWCLVYLTDTGAVTSTGKRFDKKYKLLSQGS
jgi:hypothetical protein